MNKVPHWAFVVLLTLFAVPGRADAPAGRFVAANGTVTDSKTMLEWQQVDDDVDRTRDSARTYCDGLALGGKSDWRLPTFKELLTLVDPLVTDPSIDPVFNGTDEVPYWSTTPVAGNASSGWYVGFSYGSTNTESVSTPSRVRCVR